MNTRPDHTVQFFWDMWGVDAVFSCHAPADAECKKGTSHPTRPIECAPIDYCHDPDPSETYLGGRVPLPAGPAPVAFFWDPAHEHYQWYFAEEGGQE